MPNRPVHDAVGLVAGGSFAFATSAGEPSLHRVIETIAGSFGGLVGSRMPDLLEPASLGPNHRQVAHSVVALGGLASFLGTKALQSQAFCRAEASRALQEASCHEPGCWHRLWLELVALVFTILAGLIGGATVGYISHLVLDSGTPSGLPLLTR